MATPPVLTTPKTRTKKRRVIELSPLHKQLIAGFSLLVLIALLLTATWYITRIEALQLKSVEVTGGFTIPHAAVEGIVWEELSGTYLRLIPRTFRYTYPEESIVAAVSSFPRLKQTSIMRDGSKLLVAFEEYEPYALWCQSASDDTCLFIDHTGYAFSEAPNLTGTALIRFQKNNDEPTLKTSVFESGFLREVREFTEALERDLDLYVTHVHGEGDYDVLFTLSGGGVLKVSQTQPFSTSLANLKTILVSEEFAHIEPGNFQYIDLRFGDKVFVNEEAVVATSTASTTAPEIMTLTDTPATPVEVVATSSEE